MRPVAMRPLDIRGISPSKFEAKQLLQDTDAKEQPAAGAKSREQRQAVIDELLRKNRAGLSGGGIGPGPGPARGS